MTDNLNSILSHKIVLGSWNACSWTHSSDDMFLRICHEAFMSGLRCFDTAEGYGNGHAEMLLGRALRKHREQCIISSKFQHTHSAEKSLRNALTRTLRRLNTDYIDIYYQHWPPKHIPLDETIEALLRVKEEGLIRWIGVSNWTKEEFTECSLVSSIDSIQVPYNLLWRSGEEWLFPFCRKHHIHISCYAPFCQGLLLKKVSPCEQGDPRLKNRFLKQENSVLTTTYNALEKLSNDTKISKVELCLGWIKHKVPDVSIVTGCSNLKQLEEILDGRNKVLSIAESVALEDLSKHNVKETDHTSLWNWHSRK